MDNLFSHCMGMISGDAPLLMSVVLAGLIGGVTHCSVMCSPWVVSSMLAQEGAPRASRLGYLHTGRITTYMLLGAGAVLATGWLFGEGIRNYSQYILLFAGLGFVLSAVLPQKTHNCCAKETGRLAKWEHRLSPKAGLWLRGMMMGTMPCGMTLSVLLVVATLQHPIEAMLVMAAFGLANTPMLQLSGIGFLRLRRYSPTFAHSAGRGVMALNGLFLCSLGLNLVSLY